MNILELSEILSVITVITAFINAIAGLIKVCKS